VPRGSASAILMNRQPRLPVGACGLSMSAIVTMLPGQRAPRATFAAPFAGDALGPFCSSAERRTVGEPPATSLANSLSKRGPMWSSISDLLDGIPDRFILRA